MAESKKKPPTGYEQLVSLLNAMLSHGGSDLHVSSDRAPKVRINGQLQGLKTPPLPPDVVDKMISGFLSESNRKELSEKRRTTFVINLKEFGLYYCDLFLQSKGLAFVVKPISEWPLENPLTCTNDFIERFCAYRAGLVFVTGEKSSGLSATLAAMVHSINTSRRVHISTIENRITYIHQSLKSLVHQKQIGGDVLTVQSAIESVKDEDVDVLVLDCELSSEDLRAAVDLVDSGMLVFIAAHSSSAIKTVERMMHIYAEGSRLKEKVFIESLIAVINQRLLRSKDGESVKCAQELLFNNRPMSEFLLSHQLGRAYELMVESPFMHTLEDELEKLIVSDQVDSGEKEAVTRNRQLFNRVDEVEEMPPKPETVTTSNTMTQSKTEIAHSQTISKTAVAVEELYNSLSGQTKTVKADFKAPNFDNLASDVVDGGETEVLINSDSGRETVSDDFADGMDEETVIQSAPKVIKKSG